MKLPIRLPKQVYSFFNNKYTNNKYTLNKYILYLVAAVALVQMIVFLSQNKVTALVVFIALALAMLLVTRNMTLILLVPLIVVNLFLAGKIIKEGLENASDSDKKKDEKEGDAENKTDNKKKKEGDNKKHDPVLLNGSATSSGTTPPPEAFEPGTKARAGVTGGPRVDYGATLENAYNNLNQILGNDGMNKLTSDTKNLVDQQKQLAEAMKNMGPLMTQASDMMKTFQSSGMMNMLPGANAGGAAAATPPAKK